MLVSSQHTQTLPEPFYIYKYLKLCTTTTSVSILYGISLPSIEIRSPTSPKAVSSKKSLYGSGRVYAL